MQGVFQTKANMQPLTVLVGVACVIHAVMASKGHGGMSQNGGLAPMCLDEGTVYQDGDSFTRDCNRCWCIAGAIHCMDAPCPDICTLPKDSGSCTDFQLWFHYNSENGACEPFDYGGCGGNPNRFSTLENCKNSRCGKVQGKYCFYKGVDYASGDTFYTDCNKCVCIDGTPRCMDRKCAEICPPGWGHVGKHCYKAYQKKCVYSEAVEKCSQMPGAMMVSPITREDNFELAQYTTLLNRKKRSWLGLETTFSWRNGSVLSGWTNWEHGHPRDCLSFNPFRDFRWTQVYCNRTMATICQMDIVLYYLTNNIKNRVDKNAENLQWLAQGQGVVFTASVTTDLDVAKDSVVMFDKVKPNAGESFSTADSVFTCHTPGYYRFFVHALARDSSYFWLHIKVNEEQLVSVYGREGDGNQDSSSNSAFVHLLRGDKVRVVSSSYDAISRLRGSKLDIFVTFSGHLISPDPDPEYIPTEPAEILHFRREFVDTLTADSIETLKDSVGTNSERIYQLSPLNEVFFTAGLKADLMVGLNSPVIFDKVIFNVGVSYDSRLGTFTCKHSGSYRFDVSALALEDKWFWLVVQLKEKNIISIFAEGGVGNQNSASNSAIVHLTQGDVVRVVTEYFPDVSELRSGPNNAFVTFSGQMIATQVALEPLVEWKPENEHLNVESAAAEMLSYIGEIEYDNERKLRTIELPQHMFFSVGLDANTTVESGDVVVFNKYISIVGPGYDTGTGVFTCQYPGFYQFDVNALAMYQLGFHLALQFNNVSLVSVYGRAGHQNQDSASNSAFVYLRQEDQVRVVSSDDQDPSQLRGLKSGVFVTFSGMLISAEGAIID